MKKVKIFDNQMVLQISEEDWSFLCQYRLFSDDPPIDEIQAEFVSGTGITKNKQHLWKKANERFSEYIQDLREILELDTNKMTMDTLTYEEKHIKQND
jgi:hypothetical protein